MTAGKARAMPRNIVETVLGAVVLAVALGFLAWAYGRSDAGDPGGYTLRAKFDRVDGLDTGGDVRISGIKVGKVVAQGLDPQTYRAQVTFSVRNGIELPSDSSAAVVSSGLLGGKYLSLVPGGDDRLLKDGDEITLTQSAVNLEDLIGRYIFGGQAKSGEAQ
jgi:phospholipid/cholesterol/gamma-HCH transport system substrate-binding protein